MRSARPSHHAQSCLGFAAWCAPKSRMESVFGAQECLLGDVDCTAQPLRKQIGPDVGSARTLDLESAMVMEQLYASMHAHDLDSFPLDP